MARIPDDEIERLRREISMERLVTSFGVELKRHGAELLGRCPFHDDKTPSLVVSPKTNLWHCLGKCNIGGSAIDWVMKTQGVSFRHAVELLKSNHPSLAAGNAHVVKKGTTVKLEAPITPDADDQVTLQNVVEFYHKTLKESPEALRYLESRGLTNTEMIGHFKIGFANRKLGLTLPDKNRKAGADLRGRLQRLGILRAESGHEHMNGSVVFPIFSLAGEVLGMYGRKITPGLREGTPLHLYLPGPHRGVWNEEALMESKEIILCESIIDALTFWCAGYRNVTASYGVNGFTDDHRAAFKKYETRRVLIAYDRDEAGEKASATLASELMAMGIECFRVLFPKKMDANEYASNVKPAPKTLGLLLNSAQWLGKGKAPERETVEIITVVATPEPVTKPEPAAKEKPAEPNPSLAAVSVPSVAPIPALCPPPPAVDVHVEAKENEIVITQGDRRYRVRGMAKNLSHDFIKINLLASRSTTTGDAFHADTLSLTTAHQRALFAKQAAVEMGVKEDVVRRDLGRVLLKLEELQDEQIRKKLEPKKPEAAISDADRTAALDLLKDPNLLDRILDDFQKCGVVGEETNKKVGYLAAVSRLLDAPLAVIVQSSSAAGKSSLMEAVLALMPEEQRVQFSAMTGQSLFYMGETDLKNKILAIVEEEGAQRAAYALKLLQSEGVLTIASTGKDPASGKLVTHQYRVEGPVMIFLTTTAIEIDEELLNRCLVLTVDEDREQTRAIHRIQREAQTLEGLLAKQEREDILKLHRNAQRLLRPLAVVNPYARDLTFLDSLTRTRRDHTKYLTLIRTIALLHQHQRQIKTATHREKTIEYIEATRDDITLATKLAHEVLGKSLDDLPPQTRRLLLLVDQMVRGECERQKIERSDFFFSRRDVRQHTGWSDAQLKRHLHKLEELEYLVVHRGGRGQSFVYELYFQPPADPRQPFLPGLIEVQIHNYDGKWNGAKSEKNPSSTPQVRGGYGGGAGRPEPITTGLRNGFSEIPPKTTDTGERGSRAPYIQSGGER